MIPPTWTIREEDRNEMFIQRHIDMPAESRCWNGHLTWEAFLSLTPYKVENRPISRQNLMNMLKTYRARVNSKKHLDFDDHLCMTDADYTKLTDFTRAQHTQILSYIPSTALKNSVTRSALSMLIKSRWFY